MQEFFIALFIGGALGIIGLIACLIQLIKIK